MYNVSERLTEEEIHAILQKDTHEVIKERLSFVSMFSDVCEHVLTEGHKLTRQMKDSFINLIKVHSELHGEFIHLNLALSMRARKEKQMQQMLREINDKFICHEQILAINTPSKNNGVPSKRDKWNKPWY